MALDVSFSCVCSSWLVLVSSAMMLTLLEMVKGEFVGVVFRSVCMRTVHAEVMLLERDISVSMGPSEHM